MSNDRTAREAARDAVDSARHHPFDVSTDDIANAAIDAYLSALKEDGGMSDREATLNRRCQNCAHWTRRDDLRMREVSKYGKCSWPHPPIIDALIEAVERLGQTVEPDTIYENHRCAMWDPAPSSPAPQHSAGEGEG